MIPLYNNIFNKNDKVLIIGILPPPLGGISVHIYRLYKLLLESNINAEVWDISKEGRFSKYFLLICKLLFSNYTKVHIHIISDAAFLILLALSKIKNFKIVFTDHNPRLFEGNKRKVIPRLFLKNAGILIAVSEQVIENYKKYNISFPQENYVQNAFLPPPMEEKDRIMKTYKPAVKAFLERKKPLLLANAFQISFYKGEDLYGLDLCVELTARLKKEFPNIGFIFALANERIETEYLREIKERIIQNNIEDDFLFVNGQKELWALFPYIDLFIRPTNTDGDAISIREALYFNRPVIASDCSRRLKEVVLFKTRNLDELYLKTAAILHA